LVGIYFAQFLVLGDVSHFGRRKMQNLYFHQTAIMQIPTKPQIGPYHEHLSDFVGTWSLKEKDGLTPAQVPREISGQETFRWMIGGYFLEYRFDRVFDGKRHTGLGVIGYDESTKRYFARIFDNLGFARNYDVDLDFNEMRFTGKHERAVLAIGRDRIMDIHWEHSRDGHNWSSLCDMEGTLLH
jgi:hypothetical protein